MVGRYESILLALVDPPGQALRERIDPDKIRELAESIREQGLIQPVTLRPVNGRYEIVAGHRRYLAHQFLGLVEIKALIKEMTDIEMGVMRATENLQREDLSPIEEAKAYRMLMDVGGLSRIEVAKKVGKSPFTIDKFSRLLKLPECVQEALDKRQIGLQVGLELGEIGDEAMLVYYLDMAVKNGVTAVVVKGWVEDYFKSKEGNLYSDGPSNPLAAKEVDTAKNYTSCNYCQDPIEIKHVVHLIICQKCVRKLKEIKHGESNL